jgi:outer membrane protein OmpA-like peptidoglycan-associated protein
MVKTLSAAFGAALLLFAWQAMAGELGFETTADGIAKRLLAPKIKGKIRLRGATMTKSIKVRGLTVVGRETGQPKVVEIEAVIPTDKSGGVVNLSAQFDVGSYTIRPGSILLLDELGKALRRPDLGERTVSINGHTDSDGEETYNLRLSLDRAMAVRQFLVNNYGISPDRMRVMGYGEGVPLKPNTSVEGKRLNRRVEIVAVN